MNEPRRLLSSTTTEGELSPVGRSLLLAGRARREADGARDRVWSAVVGAGAIAATTTLASGTSTTSAAPAATKAAVALAAATKTKLLIVGVVLVASGAAVGAAVHQTNVQSAQSVHSQTPSHPVFQTAAAATATATVPPAPSIEAPMPVVRAEELPVVQAPESRTKRAAPWTMPPVAATTNANASANTTTNANASSALREEAAELAAARVDLARGEAGAAIRRLAEAKTRFAETGRLGEERDALEARAVYASGDRDRAAALARAFMDRYPKSPLRSSMEPYTNKSSLARENE